MGSERLNTVQKDGEDRRARHLYSLATTTKNGDLKREALLFLGVLERGGSPEAARALELIRKKEKGDGDPAGKG